MPEIKQRVKAIAIISNVLIFTVKRPFDKLKPTSHVLQETTSESKNITTMLQSIQQITFSYSCHLSMQT